LLLASVVVGFFLVLAFIQNTYDVLWRLLPADFRIIQFTYRLNIYLLACIAGLTIIACRYYGQLGTQRSRLAKPLLALLVLSAAIQAGYATHQVWTAHIFGSAEEVIPETGQLPKMWYDINYVSSSVPMIEPYSAAELRVPLKFVDTADAQFVVRASLTGELVSVNIVPSPLIAIAPGEIVGQRSDNDHLVLRTPSSDADVQVRVEGVTTLPVLVGRLITFTCLSGLALMALTLLLRRKRRKDQGV
jgi:hypothetical protein